MRRCIGIFVSERIVAGLIEDHRLAGPLCTFPADSSVTDALSGMPAELIAAHIAEQAECAIGDAKVDAIGIAFPGIVRNGFIEDSPNLLQLKGIHIDTLVQGQLKSMAASAPVSVFNDADVIAAGIAATRGQLDRLIRVWFLGNGIGYGRYPFAEGIWEAGHITVSLDPKERFCGCGGRGHLEGIMGHRAMRLRFMDLEPEEVFANAKAGDQRCVDFVRKWHCALAAATSTSIHLDGPGKFFITGLNSRFIQLNLLNEFLHDMVKLSPLQGYSFEVVPGGEEIAVIGAAVNATQALDRA